jgi:hypothetical protein
MWRRGRAAYRDVYGGEEGTLMRRALLLPLFVLAAVSAVAGPAQAAATTPYVVVSGVSVSMIDFEGPLQSDQHCALSGTTSQTMTPAGGPAQLGTGRPEVDYHWNRGPFRTPGGTAILFACGGEVSVCFHPATVDVSQAEDSMTITLPVSLYEADFSFLPCYVEDLIDFDVISFVVPVSAGTVCRPSSVVLSGSGGWASVSLCGSLTPPNQPPPLAVPTLRCDSHSLTFACDVYISGGTAPITTRWVVRGVAKPAFNDLTSINGTCTAGSGISVRVTVADALGVSHQVSTTVTCDVQGS